MSENLFMENITGEMVLVYPSYVQNLFIVEWEDGSIFLPTEKTIEEIEMIGLTYIGDL